MTVHQCPKCELRFTWQTELEHHCRTDHPAFHHEYPVRGEHHDYDAVVPEPEVPHEPEVEVEHEPTRVRRTFGRPPERAW